MSTDHMHRDGVQRDGAHQESAKLPPGGVQADSTLGRKALSKDKRQPRYQINWPLLAATLVVAAIVAPAAHVWHSHQLVRNGSAFLDRADALEAEAKWGEAADNLHRYIRLFPEGTEADQARIRLAETFDRSATTVWDKVSAIQLYSYAFGLAPERVDLRRRQAELEFQIGRFAAALGHARDVLQLKPHDPLALRLQAQATYLRNRGRLDSEQKQNRVASEVKDRFELTAKEAFELALQHPEGPTEQVLLAMQLARICRDDLEKLKQPGEPSYIPFADKLVDRMVEEHPESVDAWVGRSQYRRTYGLPGADDDLDRALELDKDHKHVLVSLCAAERARSRKEIKAAIEYFEQAIAIAPGDSRGYQGLGATYAQRRDFEHAIEVFRRGLAKVRSYDAFGLQILLGETLISDGRSREAAELLGTLDRQVAELVARSPGPEADRRRASAQSLRGQWHMARAEYRPAVGLFKQSLAGKPGLADKDSDRAVSLAAIHLLLGRCYVALSEWDRAAVEFNQAAALAPDSLDAKLSAARAWQASGRLDEAIRWYLQAVTIPNTPETAWVGLAEARMRQQVALPAEERDWKDVEGTLRQAQRVHPNSPALKMLGAQLADLRDGSGQTLEMLKKVYANEPNSAALAERLLLAYESANRGAEAESTLQEFEQRTPGGKTSAAAIRLRSSLLVRRGQLDVAEKLLREGLNTVPPEAQADLKFRLAALALRGKRVEEGRRELAKLADAPTVPQGLIPLLAELALESRDLKDLAHWEAKLLEDEGDEGTLWRYYRAQRLLAEAKDAQDPRVKDAQQLAAEILRLRPSWSGGFVLKGQIDQRRNDREAAIAAYQQAIENGAQQPFVFEQLTALLYAANRFADAELYLKRLGKNAERTPELAGLAIPIHMHLGDLDKAIELARHNVKSRPDNPAGHVWLGQTLLAADKKEDAEASFRRAVELGPQDAPAWQGLFTFYARTGQIKAARDTLVRMTQAVKLPEERRPFVLAQGYEVLGDRDLARAQYQKAVEAAPKDAIVNQRAAGFFALEDAALAEQYQRRVLELTPDSDQARRGLVSLLITRGDEKAVDEAERLVDAGKSINGDLDPQDQRLKALVLLRRGGTEGRERARRLLEDLAAREQALPSDRLLLAGILEGDGHFRLADKQMFIVASRDDAPPSHLVTYIEMMLRNERNEEIGPWMERLIKAAPNWFPTLSVRTRWLSATKRSDEAAALIEAFLSRRLGEAKSDAETSQVLFAVGHLCEQANLDAITERCYRDLAHRAPHGYAPLANWLASHQRLGEAVTLCIEAASSDSSVQPAVVLARALIVGNAPAEELKRAEPLLSQAIASRSDAPDLIFAVATLRLLSGHRDEAVSMMRKVLVLEPRNVMARNNLASLLSERPADRKEALRLIDEAIVIGGRTMELLDTKGMILLRDSQITLAIEFLQEAAMRPVADPRHLFHLSLAYQKAGKLDDARKALKLANGRALNVTLLSPDERLLLVQLERDLGA